MDTPSDIVDFPKVNGSAGGPQVVSSDPLDQQDYNPVLHLQTLFSVPSNLTKLSQVKEIVDQRCGALNKQLRTPSNSNTWSDALERAANGPKDLVALLAEIEALKSKAAMTENVITNMTSHIISLDNTKSNLIRSITILKRLQMLTTAYDQLASLVRHRQYKEMTQTLPAVQELMAYFKPYRSISQVATLSRQIGDIQVVIANQIFEDFERVIERNEMDAANGLADACQVLVHLGDINKTRLINWYCSSMLREYRTIFRNSDEAGSLENVSRRYAYFKRILKTHKDTNQRYFSTSWAITEELCKGFCNTTREDIKTLLAQSGKSTDVQLLLKALQESLDFEQYLEKRFASESRQSLDVNEFSEKPLKFDKAISVAFQPHLSIWIDFQGKQLASKMAQYKAPPAPSEEETEAPTVLPSSADLFLFYRHVLGQTAKLSTGAPLLDLAKLFARYLNIYSTSILNPTFPDKVSSEDDIRTIALIMNTADYCFNTTSQLEERIQNQIDAEFKEKVNFENEKSAYLDIANQCIRRLVAKVESSCDYAWREMTNTNWGKLETVGDQSSYVSELQKNITTETGLILKYITKDLYVRLVCDKVVESVMNAFLSSVVRCRPISEVTSEQMLLDLYVLRSTFLKLPSLKEGADPQKPPSGQFTRHVTKSLARIETILKVILTQPDPAEGLVQNYFYLIGDKSSENFGKILELKGLNRSSQSRFQEMFKSHMTAHDNLVDESPILQSLSLTNTNGFSHVQTFSPTIATQSRFDLLSKDSIEKGFERIAQGTETPVIKLNENLKTSFGRLFRRDTSGTHSPVSK